MIDPIVQGAFDLLARLRKAPAFHPKGAAFHATFSPATTVPPGLSMISGNENAVVRFSRGGGLPESWPDLFGFALRLPDAYGPGRHQDLLLTSGSRRPGLRRVLVPGLCPERLPYTSLAPYRFEGRQVLFLAVPDPGTPVSGLGTLRREGAAGTTLRLGFTERGCPWRHLADVVIGEKLDDPTGEQIEFDPSNTGSGLELAGLINRLRLPAYRGSRKGRQAIRENQAKASAGEHQAEEPPA